MVSATLAFGRDSRTTELMSSIDLAELLRTMQGVFAQAGAAPDLQNAAALHYLGRVVQAQAYTMGFRDSFLIVAIVFTLALTALPALASQPLGALTDAM